MHITNADQTQSHPFHTHITGVSLHARIQIVLSERAQLNFDVFFFYCCFLAYGGKEDLNANICGPSLAKRFAGVPIMAQHGILAW